MNKQQKARLIGLSHPLNPAVTIAEKGLTDNILQDINSSLNASGLIKIKFSGYGREDKLTLVNQICDSCEAEVIQKIGHIAVIYRKKAEKAKGNPTRSAWAKTTKKRSA